MSGNVLLQDNSRHTRTLPLLKDRYEANREVDLRGLGSFAEVMFGTMASAFDEGA